MKTKMEVHFDRQEKTPTINSSRRNSAEVSGADDTVFVSNSVLKSTPGLHEWTTWRTRLNSDMVDLIEERHRIFSYPNSKKHIKPHTRIIKSLTEPRFGIGRGVSEFALSRAVHDYVHGEDGFHLDAESFLSFGIPRVKLRSNLSYRGDEDPETPFSPTSYRATDGSVSEDGRDKLKELEVGSNEETEVIYSESTKKKNRDSGVIDLDSSAPFETTADFDECEYL